MVDMISLAHSICTILHLDVCHSASHPQLGEMIPLVTKTTSDNMATGDAMLIPRDVLLEVQYFEQNGQGFISPQGEMVLH